MSSSSLPPLIPHTVLFGNPDKASPELSPDGTRLAYLAPLGGVLNVWVGAADGTGMRPVTRATGLPSRRTGSRSTRRPSGSWPNTWAGGSTGGRTNGRPAR